MSDDYDPTLKFTPGQVWEVDGWPYFVQYTSAGTFLLPSDTHALDLTPDYALTRPHKLLYNWRRS